MADGAGYINGEVVTIDGGEWLQGAGQFNFIGEHDADADWQALKPEEDERRAAGTWRRPS